MAAAACSASAAVLNWAGPGPGTTTAPVSGIWDTNSLHWNTGSGAGVRAFTNAADGAFFGGPDGSYFIQCVTNLVATNITFAATGYTLTNDSPTIITIPAGRSVIVSAGKTGTIGTNVTVSGNGNAFFFNPNLNSGTLVVEGGGVLRQSVNQPFQIDGGPGSKIRIQTNGVVALTGNGSNIRMGVSSGASPEVVVEGGLFACMPGGPSITIGSANGATGTLTMISGVVSNSGAASIRLCEGAGSTGTLNLNGGELLVERIIRGNGTNATFNLNGGTIRAVNGTSGATFMNGLTTANVRNNMSTIDNGGFTITIGQHLLHSTIAGDNATDGGLAFTGFGTTTLNGTNTYTGPTIITNGTLALGLTGSINGSTAVRIGASGTLSLSNRLFFNTTSSFTLADGTLNVEINNFPTNIVTGTFGTEGSFNTINVLTIVGSGSIPQAKPLIKYTTLAPGVVDGNNNLATLFVNLPAGFAGYLTNNTAKKTIDLVLTSGSLTPQVVTDPQSITRFAGATAQFSVSALGADGYFWRVNGSFLNDGPNVVGSKTNVLTLSNVSTTASYDVVLTNSSGSVISAPAVLTVVNPVNYAGTNMLFGPVSYYRFTELDNFQPAADWVGGKDGTFLAQVQHLPGPVPADGYVNFEGDNAAFLSAAGFADAHVVVSNSWNINTNTVTLVGWVYPVGVQNSFAGIIFQRGGGVTCGLNYSGSLNGVGERTLGYTWNNDGNTYNWNSGLVPPQYQWSMVALVITPTNATIYVANTNGVASAVNTYAHPVQSFVGPITLGSDSFSPTARSFTGYIDEVSAFDKVLSQDQILALLTAASGLSNFPPTIVIQPVASTTVFEHQTVQLSAQASGTGTLSYRWERGVGGAYSPVPNGSTGNGSAFSGGTTPTLVISNISSADAMDYVLTVSNAFGGTISSVATITVSPTQPPTTFTTSVIQTGGSNWDTDGTWNVPGSATALAAEFYGSTFVVQAPGGLRTPDLGNPGSPTTATFPGDVLRVEGNGTYDTSLNNAGAIRIKGGNPGTVHFRKLVMAGGQICNILNNGWPAILTGEVNVISNSVVWASDDTSPRSITIASKLTGDGGIRYRAYNNFSTLQTGSSASLNISGENNTFTGVWIVELGVLVGSGVNALGTNTITVDAQGALQTTYDVNNPAGDLILNGRMYLTQNDTFRRVFVNGTQLAAGTHSYASLAAAFPAAFPATWTGVTGALTSTSATGSITVLDGPAAPVNPGTVQVTRNGANLEITWTNTSTLLLSATNIVGPWVTNTGATSPFTVTNDTPQKFFRLQAQ